MASIKKIEGKTGTSYKITVTCGRDSSGRQIRHYKTWTPDRPMTARQMEKEAQRAAFEFEREIELGFQADDRQTFEQYANYFIEMQERSGRAANTLLLYRRMMKRLVPAIGHMKLKDIRPQHLNELNKELAKAGIRQDPILARPKDGFREFVYSRFPSQRALAAAAEVDTSVLCECCQGKQLRLTTARKLAAALGEEVDTLFEVITHDAPLSGNTLSHYHSFVTSVLRQAEREMLIPYNPGLRVAPPKVEKEKPNYFQPEELARIIDALDDEPIRWKAMIHLFIVTGCRRGEILALKWSKVDLEKRVILIDASASFLPGQGMVEGGTKTGRARTVTIPAETAALLKKYRSWQTELRLQNMDRWQDNDFVFTRDNGLPQFPTTLASWLNSFSRRHGLPHINPHSFRHTAASIMIAEGVDIVTVSKMLGHANPSITTDVYSHAIADAQRRASECIADVMLRRKRA